MKELSFAKEPSLRINYWNIWYFKKGAPWGYNPEANYLFQVLKRGWVTRGRGKPTLKNISRWRKLADEATNAFRVRIQLPNGVWFSAFCGTCPYSFLVAVERYLKKLEAQKD